MKYSIKLIGQFVLFALFFGTYACNQTSENAEEEGLGERMISREDSLLIPPADTVLDLISDSDSLIVAPGGSIGMLVLKTEFPGAAVNRLGRPDSSDAATCKSWSMWYWDQNQRELDIFAACDPEVDMRKTMKIIRISGFEYTAEQDGGTVDQRSSFEDIRSTFPTGHMIAIGPDGSSRSDSLYQVPDKGIAFEIDSSGKQKAILVFPVEESLEHHYIPAGRDAGQ